MSYKHMSFNMSFKQEDASILLVALRNKYPMIINKLGGLPLDQDDLLSIEGSAIRNLKSFIFFSDRGKNVRSIDMIEYLIDNVVTSKEQLQVLHSISAVNYHITDLLCGHLKSAYIIYPELCKEHITRCVLFLKVCQENQDIAYVIANKLMQTLRNNLELFNDFIMPTINFDLFL